MSSTLGMEENEAKEMKYNSLRRYMPSLGEALRFDVAEAQSLSNWTEVPKGALARRERATHPTSRSYATTKEETALLNKHKAVAALIRFVQSRASDSFDLSWRTVSRKRLNVDKAEAAVCNGWPWASPSGVAASPTPRPLDEKEEETERASLTLEAEGAPILEVDTFEDVELPELVRFGRSLNVHLRDAAGLGRSTALCRGAAFRNPPKEVDYPVGSKLTLCQGCLRKCPTRVGHAVQAYALA